ncbi:hypothetical protein [Micromonospora phytophila]|uniref:hypothetical protein n=1 Tax=Micromonospora phytophila TaxID=709888 RepID=UPI00355680B5
MHFLIFRMTSAGWFDRSADEFEFQMPYVSRPEEQTRLAGQSQSFRTYLPYDSDCYGYPMRRLAERLERGRLRPRPRPQRQSAGLGEGLSGATPAGMIH